MRWLSNLTIRNKLHLAILTASGVVLGLATVAYVVNDVMRTERTQVEKFSVLGDVIADNVAPAIAFGDPDTARQVLKALGAEPSVLFAAIYRADGAPFERFVAEQAGSGGDWVDADVRQYAGGRPSACPVPEFKGDHLHLCKTITLAGEPLGSLFLTVSLAALHGQLLSDLGIGLLVLLLALALTYVIARPLARTLSDPLMQLTGVMQKVSARKDYGLRLPVQGRDEIGVLSEGFNQMLAEIGQRDARLEEYSTGLERMVEERTARLSEQARILDQIHDSVVSSDLDGIITGWNKGAERLFGYTAGEALGRPITFVYPEEEHAFLAEQVIAPLMAKGEHEVEVRMRRKSGEDFYAGLSLSLLRDAGGRVAGMIGYSMDISARKRAEAALEKSQENLRATLEATEDGILAVDRNGAIAFANGRFARMWRIPDDLPVQGQIDRRFLEHVQTQLADPAGFVARVREIYASDRECLDILDFADGRVFERYSRPLTKDGRVYGRVWSFRDITERSLAERELRLARDVAEQASRAKSEFLSSMSHELRTPMNAILGFAQLLAIEQDLGEEQADNVQEILKAGRHLLQLINEVLDLSRIESGNQPISMESVDVADLIRECLVLVESDALRQGLALHREPGSCEGRCVRADRLRLKQALLNLLSNAVKYNREGGSVGIECSESRPGRVRLSVVDTGPGIPENKQAQLFTAFNRLGREGSAIEGTGIGLVITKRLIELMGGQIGLHSRPGDGSTFWVELAAAAPVDGLAPQEPSGVSPDMEPPSSREAARTVLYIEDNPANLRFMEQLLARRRDLRLLSCNGPEQGLELAHRERPDLVLLDINLPGIDGYEVLSRLRAGDATRRIPVVAVTANAMAQDMERGREAGFDEYLAKPLDIQRVMGVIDLMLDESGRPGEARRDE